jgi:protein-S-isoprenylcysteine O-methyltransferase Ste14
MNKIIPPALMLICLLGMMGLDLVFPIMQVSNWLLLLAGVLFIIVGLAVGFGSEGQFRKRGTTVDPRGTVSTLVTDGWFRYSRNPMYLSFVLILAGAWLSMGSPSPILGILAFVLLTERWYIIPEEQRLAVSFGQQYQAYRLRTRRWI